MFQRAGDTEIQVCQNFLVQSTWICKCGLDLSGSEQGPMAGSSKHRNEIL